VDYYASYGKHEAELAMWNAFTVNGGRATYSYAFAYGNYAGLTIPRGLCKPTTAMGNLFYAYQGVELPKGVDCSTFNVEAEYTTYYLNLFGYANKLKYIYDMGIPALKSYAGCYRFCSALETIEIIRSNEGTEFDGNSFNGCSALAHVTFHGTVAKNLDIHWSTKLSRESILSLLQVLKASVTGVTITLPAKCIDTATDTLVFIQGDTELNTAYTQALANGYTIAFQ
jgi:hypothetical protein